MIWACSIAYVLVAMFVCVRLVECNRSLWLYRSERWMLVAGCVLWPLAAVYVVFYTIISGVFGFAEWLNRENPPR